MRSYIQKRARREGLLGPTGQGTGTETRGEQPAAPGAGGPDWPVQTMVSGDGHAGVHSGDEVVRKAASASKSE